MPRKKEAWLKASAPLGAHQDVPQPSGRVAMLSRVLRVTETYLPTVRLLQSVRLLTASPASWLSSQEGQRPTVRGVYVGIGAEIFCLTWPYPLSELKV